ncbi:MAG: hypothetical protein CMG34_01240 [Candidatus Marinimicrobia bacterium]|nr:hypothetical protein [Candidatus Neomarinimicrobiota bacterium]
MNKILHNQTLWIIVWAYTLILYPYHFISLLATGKQPIIISETFTGNLFIVSGIIIVPLMAWGAYNQFRIAREQKTNKKPTD